MKENLELFDVVAIIEDKCDYGLVAGQVGTIVEVLGDGVFEVEFCDNDSESYASLALRSDEVMSLYYSPVAA